VVLAVICHVCLDCVTPVVVGQSISTLFSAVGLQTASALESYWTSATISQFSSVYLCRRHSGSLLVTVNLYCHGAIMLFIAHVITHADGSHVSVAIIRLCDSVCDSDSLSVQ